MEHTKVAGFDWDVSAIGFRYNLNLPSFDVMVNYSLKFIEISFYFFYTWTTKKINGFS